MGLARASLRPADQLSADVQAKRSVAAQRATVAVAQSGIDLQARYLDPTDIEVARFHMHIQQLRVDAAVRDAAAVAGEVAGLEWILARIPDAFEAAELTAVDQGLGALREATSAGDLAAAADQATRLASDVRNLTAH